MRNYFVILLLTIVVEVGFPQSETTKDLFEGYYNQLSGVWQFSQEVANDGTGSFSWGNSPYSIASLIVDLGDKRPYLFSPGQLLVVENIKQISHEQFEVYWHDLDFLDPDYRGHTPRSEHKGMLVLHFVKKDELWIDWRDGVRAGFALVGEGHHYFRTSGPS